MLPLEISNIFYLSFHSISGKEIDTQELSKCNFKFKGRADALKIYQILSQDMFMPSQWVTMAQRYDYHRGGGKIPSSLLSPCAGVIIKFT